MPSFSPSFCTDTETASPLYSFSPCYLHTIRCMRISNTEKTARRRDKRVEKGSKSNRATAVSLRRAIFYLHLHLHHHHHHRILAESSTSLSVLLASPPSPPSWAEEGGGGGEKSITRVVLPPCSLSPAMEKKIICNVSNINPLLSTTFVSWNIITRRVMRECGVRCKLQIMFYGKAYCDQHRFV